MRKNQTTWKNTFLEWKFEEGNKVSIKVKQKQRFRQSSQGKTWGRNVGHKTMKNKRLKKAYEEGTTYDTTKEGMK